MRGEAREEPVEVMASELPGEGSGSLLVTLLKGDEAFGQSVKVGEIVGGQHLARHYREVDLDLVEPGGMSRKVNKAQLGPFSLKALERSLTPMGGAVVHYPEHAISRSIGLLFHHLIHQPTEGLDAVVGLAAPEELRSMHVPSGQVGQSSPSFVLVLHPHEPIFVGWQGRVAALTGLDGGLLVGRDDVFSFSESLTLPSTLVEVQYPPGFLGEVGVSGEDPGAMIEGKDRIFGKPPPDASTRDRRHDAPLHRLPRYFLSAPAAQGNPADRRKLTSEGLHLHSHRRGKRLAVCRSGVYPPVHSTPPRRSACATYMPSGVWWKASLRSPCWRFPLRPKGRSWREPPPSEQRCEQRHASAKWRPHPQWVRCGTDFDWACNKPSLLWRYDIHQKTLPRKENASRKFSHRPLRRIVDYPNLWEYTKDLYQQPGVAETVNMDHIKRHYYGSHESINPSRIVPKGPILDFTEAHDRGQLSG